MNTLRTEARLQTTTQIAAEFESKVADAIAEWNRISAEAKIKTDSTNAAYDPAFVDERNGQKLDVYVENAVKGYMQEKSSFETGIYYKSGNYTSATNITDLAKGAGFNQLTAGLEDAMNEYLRKMTDTSASNDPTTGSLATAFTNAVNSAINDTTLTTRYTGAIYTAAATANGVSSAAVTAKAANYTEKVAGIVDPNNQKIQVAGNGASNEKLNASYLAETINKNDASKYWAMTGGANNDMVYVFRKDGGNYNDTLVCDVSATDDDSKKAAEAFTFENVESGAFTEGGTTMSLGGQTFATMTPIMSKSTNGTETWNVNLSGRDVGSERDLWIANVDELKTPGITLGGISGMNRESFVEVQNADDADWKGAELRTQSSAQESLAALTDAIVKKDKIRADLGAMQNRLENTITNLEIQSENLQAAESGISDVDVAKEMTEFTKNNVLTQAATGMLAQANSMNQLALSLIG